MEDHNVIKKLYFQERIAEEKEKAFRAGVRSSDYASHTALNIALDTFIKGIFGDGFLKDPIRNEK